MQRLNIQKEGSLGRGECIADPWKRAPSTTTKRCSLTTEMATWSLLMVTAVLGSPMAVSGTGWSIGLGVSKKMVATSTVVLKGAVVATLMTVDRRRGGSDLVDRNCHSYE
jgi:hypothetical protein